MKYILKLTAMVKKTSPSWGDYCMIPYGGLLATLPA